MNEIVKYDNYLNELNFEYFSAVDLNFLMALCSRMRDQDSNEIVFTFKELKDLTEYKQTSISRFISDLESMNKKLMNVTCTLRTETKSMMFVLFPTFLIDSEEQTLVISVNEKFKFILNDILKGFTRFSLSEFVKLNSKYSKNLYRLLKQYRTTGRYESKIDDFRSKIDCPKTYSNKYVMDLIIKPSITELQDYFKNLKCDQRRSHKRGRPVTGYIFTFTPENIGEKETKINRSKTFPDTRKNHTNGYANFNQRTYDYEEIERELLMRNISEMHNTDDRYERLEKKLFDKN